MLLKQVLCTKNLAHSHENADQLIRSGVIYVNGSQVLSPLYGLIPGPHKIEKRDEETTSIDVLIIGLHLFDLKRRKK